MSNGDILISIRPEWVAKILIGEKKIEVRKTRPKVKTPFKCFIYCTLGKELWGDGTGETWWGIDPDEDIDEVFRLNPTLTQLNGKVIGEFICNYIAHSNEHLFDENKITMQKLMKSSCLSFEEINNYRGDKNIFAWYISDLKIYDKPKELSDFRTLALCPQAQYSAILDTWFCNDGYTKAAITDNARNFPYDEECIYFDNPKAGGESDKYEDYAYCMCKGHKMLSRPPQSWCYVK